MSLRCSTSPIATASPSAASTAHQANFHGRLHGKQSERTVLRERVVGLPSELDSAQRNITSLQQERQLLDCCLSCQLTT